MNEQSAPGRKSKFSGKRIVPSRKDNPRRPGSHGYRSYEIVRKRPKGISFEDYIERGGRTQDLQWDLDHGFVKVQ